MEVRSHPFIYSRRENSLYLTELGIDIVLHDVDSVQKDASFHVFGYIAGLRKDRLRKLCLEAMAKELRLQSYY